MIGFNPRSREGSDFEHVHKFLSGKAVSIHAPAKGATDRGLGGRTDDAVSIHAPAKGATLPVSVLLSFLCIVSIHAPAKGATVRVGRYHQWHYVSIHAPAKGATYPTPLEKS